jgi:hypothetical protein
MHTPPILLPDVADFAQLAIYCREWDHERMSSRAGNDPECPRPAPGYIRDDGAIWSRQDPIHPTAAWLAGHTANEIGPFGTIENVDGHPRRSIAVRPTGLTLEAIAPRIVTPDDHLSFKVHGRPEGRALVVVSHSYIIGSHWLAVVDASTLPAYPYAARDERQRDIGAALRDAGRTPFRHRSPEVGAVKIGPSDARDVWTVIYADGSTLTRWPDGSETRSEAHASI